MNNFLYFTYYQKLITNCIFISGTLTISSIKLLYASLISIECYQKHLIWGFFFPLYITCTLYNLKLNIDNHLIQDKYVYKSLYGTVHTHMPNYYCALHRKITCIYSVSVMHNYLSSSYMLRALLLATFLIFLTVYLIYIFFVYWLCYFLKNP